MDILLVEADAVKGDEPLIQIADVFQEGDGLATEFLLELCFLRLVFQQVKADRNLIAIGQLLGILQQGRGAGIESVRLHENADQRIVGPFLDQSLCIDQAFFRGSEIRGREIEENLAQQASHPRLMSGLGSFILEDIHIAESGCAGFDHLGAGQEGPPVGQFGIDVFRFGGKDEVVQPVHQGHIVGDAPEAGHGRVGMAVDQSRHDQ